MKRLAIAVCVAMGGASGASQAELVRDGVWEVEEGQKLDTVLSAAFPNEPLRQRRIERLARRLSPAAFNEAGELVAGQELRLPGARMPEQKPAEARREGEVGRVVVVSGSGSATGDDGRARPLERGAPVYKGDTLSTERARAQVRFSDGSLVSLRPNTQFKVEEYQYDGEEGEEERGLFSLIKGGFRTISGAIGKLNRDNYEVKTAVATIGIRGTHYGVTICDPCQDGDEERRGLFGGVVDGEIVVKNDQGEFTFGNDEYFHLAEGDGKPRGVIVPPGFVFGNDEDETADGEGDGGDDSVGGSGQGGYSDPDADQRSAEQNRNTPDDDFESDKDDSGFNNRRGDDLVAELEELQDQGRLPDSLDFNNEEGPLSDQGPQFDGEAAGGDAVVQVGFIGDGSVWASLGEGVSEGLAGTNAFISERSGGGYDLSGVDFTDGDDTRFIFSPEGATLSDAGFDETYGLSWGRWDDAVITATGGEEDGLEDASIEVPVKTGLHFMVSEHAVGDYNDLAAAIDEHGFNSGYGTSIYLGPKFVSGTGFFGSSPTDMAGNEGNFNNGYLQIDDSGSGYEITAFGVNAEIADNDYNLTGGVGYGGAVLVEDFVNDPSQTLELSGSCFSGSPGAACYGGSVSLEGTANFQFLINRGGSNVGAATMINGYAPTDPDVGFSGSILFTDDGGV